jgi:hypothetical protein
LLHKLLGKICICQGGFGFDLLIDLQEKIAGKICWEFAAEISQDFFS